MSRRADQSGALAFETPPIGDIERSMARRGVTRVIGVDEVGRGPLAGPVVVAAVVLDPGDVAWCDGLNDSKQLTAEERERWALTAASRALAYARVEMSPAEVDELNVLWASLEGMRRAVEAVRAELGLGLEVPVLVDGNRPIPRLDGDQRTIIKGDARSWTIAAASVIAKVHRDAYMVALDAEFPGYGFASHKGYPTPTHRAALTRLGPTPHHRRSFRPVREACEAHGVE